jgi:hypothetical protein
MMTQSGASLCQAETFSGGLPLSGGKSLQTYNQLNGSDRQTVNQYSSYVTQMNQQVMASADNHVMCAYGKCYDK